MGCSPAKKGPAHGNYTPEAEYRERTRKRLMALAVIDPTTGCWTIPTRKADAKGYVQDHWRSKSEHVHRVSFRAFKGEIAEGRQVRHLCGNAGCFNPDHLAQGTQSQNEQDKIACGTAASNRGAGRYNAKLTDDQVRAIRMRAVDEVHARLAEEFGVSRPSIGRIARREIWKYVA